MQIFRVVVTIKQSNNKTCGLLPITISNFSTTKVIGSNASPLLPFLQCGLSRKQQLLMAMLKSTAVRLTGQS
jgi:hypothetical protein